MNQIRLPANTMAQRLYQLARLYQRSPASALVTRTVDKLLAYEAETCRTQQRQIQRDLREFEQKYSITSANFYQQFQAGQTDDRMDYIEWASLVQMAANLEERLQLLTEESFQ